MNKLFETSNCKINYDEVNGTAVIQPKNTTIKSNSIAMICFKNTGRSLWDKIRCFCLENFTWNWLRVNNGSPHSTQIISISSISKQLGIQPDKIRELNKSGMLYQAICTQNYELSIKNEHIDILNGDETQKIEQWVGIEKERKAFVIYFDKTTKAIQVEYNERKSYKSLDDIQNSYPMKATAYTEKNKYYLRIHTVYHTNGIDHNSLYSGPEADILRQEVLNIYKTSK